MAWNLLHHHLHHRQDSIEEREAEREAEEQQQENDDRSLRTLIFTNDSKLQLFLPFFILTKNQGKVGKFAFMQIL